MRSFLCFTLPTLMVFQDIFVVAKDTTRSSSSLHHFKPHHERRKALQTDQEHILNDANIRHAVKEWMKNRDETKAKFGHISSWDVSRVTHFDHLFSIERSPSLSEFSENISAWETQSVTSMSHLFYGNSAMDLDLGQWNVSQVVDMTSAFAQTKRFVGHGLKAWDTSKLVNASSMFHQAIAFDSNGVPFWNVSSLVDASRMFHATKAFKGHHKWKWNSHNLQDISEMFAHSLKFVGNLKGMDVSSVTNMRGVFFKAIEFNGNLSTWKTDNVKDMNSMFAFATAFQGKGLEEWNVANVTSLANMMKRTAFDRPLSKWNVEKVTDMRNMFRYDESMDQKVCWTLHKKVIVDGIFFQSQGHFDRSCVKHRDVVKSCCRPDIDNACECGEKLINDEVAPVENGDKENPSVSQPQPGAVGATTSSSSSFLDETQYLMALGVASISVTMALLFFATRKFRLRNRIATTTMECGGADDLNISDLDIPRSHPLGDSLSTTPTVHSTNSFREEEDLASQILADLEILGPMEDISVRGEII